MYLGFGIIFSENGSLKTINFDIISTDEKSDAMAAVRGFRILRNQHFFKQIDKKNYIIWSDCGLERLQKFQKFNCMRLSI